MRQIQFRLGQPDPDEEDTEADAEDRQTWEMACGYREWAGSRFEGYCSGKVAESWEEAGHSLRYWSGEVERVQGQVHRSQVHEGRQTLMAVAGTEVEEERDLDRNALAAGERAIVDQHLGGLDPSSVSFAAPVED